jgi:hypothetical protein
LTSTGVVSVNGRALSNCIKGCELELPRKIKDSRQHKAIANIFTGQSVVTRAESIQWITNAIDVIEEFTYGAAQVLAMARV